MATGKENFTQKLQGNFQKIDPTQASGGIQAQLYGQSTKSRPNPTAAPKAEKPGFFAALGNTALSAAKGAPKLGQKIATTIFVEPFKKTSDGIAMALTGNQRLDQARRSSDVNLELSLNLTKMYRAGKLSREQYNAELADISTSNTEIMGDIKTISQGTDAGASRDFVINAYASVLTPLSMAGAAGRETGRLIAQETAEGGFSRFAPRVSAYLSKGGETLEQAMTRLPTVRTAIARTPEANTLKKTAFNALVKNPIQLNLAVREPVSVLYDASQGKYGQAAISAGLIGLMPFAGGPLGVAGKYGGKLVNEVKLRAFGKAGFIDEVGRLVKDSPVEYLEGLRKTDPAKYEESVKAWKAFEAYNINKFDGDVKATVENIAEWHAKHSNPLGNYTAAELTDYWIDFRNTLQTVQTLGKKGALTVDGVKVEAGDVGRIGIGKFGTEEKYALIAELKKLGSAEERQAVVAEMIADGYGWAQSPTMRGAIEHAVQGDDFAKALLKVSTGKAVKIAGGSADAFPRNYFPIYLNKSAKGYDTEVLENIDSMANMGQVSDVLDRSIAPKGIAGAVGGFFEKLGLSPQDRNAAAYLAVRRNVAHNLLDNDIKIPAEVRGNLTDSDYILQKLGEYADTKRAVFDLRQLTINEIKDTLRMSTREAKLVRQSITQSYLEIPLQLRGIGDKIVDANLRYNPLAAPYARAQGAARYAYNPFFATQEIIEAEVIAQATVGGKRVQLPGINVVRNIFTKERSYYDEVIQSLDKKGIFSAASGRSEFASEALTGGISAKLRGAQKLSIAGFVDKLAVKRGMTVDQYLDNYGEEAAQLTRQLVQYPKNSGLNSPLMRTLNVIAFPTRYNVKVATIAAQVISKQTPLNQMLILTSLMNLQDWVGSDEGMAWQSRNAEFVGLMKYFTPLNSLNQISKILTGKAEAASDFGSLGGLPFGVIGQILDHQGLFNLSTPYINPRTGDIMPEYVPQTDKARVKTALDDLLGSVFSWPGRTIGLGSKGEVIDIVTEPVTGVRKYSDEYKEVSREGELKPKDLRRQQVIREANGQAPPPEDTNVNPFASQYIPPPTVGLKPLVTRPVRQSIDARTRGRQAAEKSSPSRTKKTYKANTAPLSAGPPQ